MDKLLIFQVKSSQHQVTYYKPHIHKSSQAYNTGDNYASPKRKHWLFSPKQDNMPHVPPPSLLIFTKSQQGSTRGTLEAHIAPYISDSNIKRTLLTKKNLTLNPYLRAIYLPIRIFWKYGDNIVSGKGYGMLVEVHDSNSYGLS